MKRTLWIILTILTGLFALRLHAMTGVSSIMA